MPFEYFQAKRETNNTAHGKKERDVPNSGHTRTFGKDAPESISHHSQG